MAKTFQSGGRTYRVISERKGNTITRYDSSGNVTGTSQAPPTQTETIEAQNQAKIQNQTINKVATISEVNSALKRGEITQAQAQTKIIEIQQKRQAEIIAKQTPVTKSEINSAIKRGEITSATAYLKDKANYFMTSFSKGTPNTNVYTLVQPELQEKFNKAIEKQNKEFKDQEVDESLANLDLISKGETPEKYSNLTPTDISPVLVKAKNKVLGFNSLTNEQKRDKVANFLETNIQKGVDYSFQNLNKVSLPVFPFILGGPNGKVILEDVRAKQQIIDETGAIPQERYNTLSDVRSIGSNIIYGTATSVAQTPTTILRAYDFIATREKPQQKVDKVKEYGKQLVTTVTKEPVTTIGTAVGTYFTFKLLSGGGQTKAQKIASKIEKKVLMDLELKGEVYYNPKTDSYIQLRKVDIPTQPNKVQPATIYQTEIPEQTYTVATGYKNKPVINSVTTPTGYQYTTVKEGNYFLRLETTPNGITTTKVFKGDKLIGKPFTTDQPNVFAFSEATGNKMQKQFISSEDYRIDTKIKSQSSNLIKTGKDDIRATGKLQTDTGIILETKTLKQAQTTKGKIGLDLITGKKTLEPNYIEQNPTTYKYTTYNIEKQPTKVSTLSTGEFLIEQEATALTRQMTRPKTTFQINFNQDIDKIPKPSNIVQTNKINKPFEWLGNNKIDIKENIGTKKTAPNTLSTTVLGQTKTQTIQKPQEPIVKTNAKLYLPPLTESNEAKTLAITGISIGRQNQKTETKQQQKQQPINMIVQRQQPVNKNIQIQQPVTINENIQEQHQHQSQIQTQQQEQQQKQLQQQLQKITPTKTKTPIKTPQPPTITDILPTPKIYSNKNKGGYEVLVRRNKMFKKIGTAKTIEGAFNIGRMKVQNTAGASFKVKAINSGGESITSASKRLLPAKSFYESKKEPGTFIQKRGFRISTPGEKREITFKGIATQKFRKNKGGFSWR